MTLKSINYEEIISTLIDACSLTDDRKENLAIKRSFTKKQGIFSQALHERLLNYLSGNDEGTKVVLDNLFTVLEEAMKNMNSSPVLLDMSKETYNDEFKNELIMPFSALLLFNMRFDFKKISPIYYFIDFISKNSLTESCAIDALVREYIRNHLKQYDLQHGVGDDFNNFIGKISLRSALKPQTINKKIAELKEEYDGFAKESTIIDFEELALSLHGMRLILYFKDYMRDLIGCYGYARSSIKSKEHFCWVDLDKIAKKIIVRNKKRGDIFYEKINKIINESECLSVEYHNGLDRKYNKHPNPILNYLMSSTFDRNFAFNLLDKSEQLIDGIHHHMLNVFIKIYDGHFDLAKSEIKTIIDKSEKYPNHRMISTFSKLYIALQIKDNQIKIKTNTLDFYMYKAISTERSKVKVTVAPGIAFLNEKSKFSNDAEFYTIIDSIALWHECIREMLEVDVIKSPSHGISFADKIEVALNKVYLALDDKKVELSRIEDAELKELTKSTLSTSELLENIITFIPNLTLYFALREIHFIFSGLSEKAILESTSINRFICENQYSKRKLLKAISLSDYTKDEENERNLVY